MWAYILLVFLDSGPVAEIQESSQFKTQDECMKSAKAVMKDMSHPMSAACVPIMLKEAGDISHLFR